MAVDSESIRVKGIGEGLVRVVHHSDGQFYNSKDRKRATPLTVAPIGNAVISLWQAFTGDWRYRPNADEELNLELGKRVLQMASEREVTSGQIGVRCYGTAEDRHVAEFYRIK